MKVFIVVGTRPEAIKMAPVFKAIDSHKAHEAILISTGQHREMLSQVFDWFELTPHEDLAVMEKNQTLNGVLVKSISGLDTLIKAYRPDAILAQGDTTTVLAAGLAAFNTQIDFGHVEAGLRTHNLQSPFPEEGFRQLASRIARWHFTPTDKATQALENEAVSGEIIKVGNTVIDALTYTANKDPDIGIELSGDKLILITGHRRENHGGKFDNAFTAIARLAKALPDCDLVYPVHLNPQVQMAAQKFLSGIKNVQLIPPVSYPRMIALMKRAALILTDSGGVQEEAPTFNVPVLVMRDTTERSEAVDIGAARLIGTQQDDIFNAAIEIMTDPKIHASYACEVNPFGDGQSAQRIANILAKAQ